ncbi:hypothetical protein [Brevundimonas lenta]|uniref:Uncharacterized protein n=1 Tax=Brevundimonas lenta TaxID=424796 RepID=A0A7W6JE60_9CAUL|nr:hypothetical protein [Brevundimonas lenta]MBB4083469.1 hypothetical protein [Brevundimonas lenta]
MTDGLPEAFLDGLDRLADAAARAGMQDPWWVFGGAAMALVGLRDWRVPDIDVLTSSGDARRLLAALGAEIVTDPGEGQFRSRVYGRTRDEAVPIEVMAGLEVRTGPDWSPVVFETRVPVAAGDHILHIPALTEQIAVARQFGRPKDLSRADALERLIDPA